MVEAMERNWIYLLFVSCLITLLLFVILQYFNLKANYNELRELVYNNKVLHECVIKHLEGY